MSDINKYVVIVAGGKGARMGNVIPKQFLPLQGKPMLCYSIEAFVTAIPGIQLILVLPPDELSAAAAVLKPYLSNIAITYIGGGETRYHSVQNGLSCIKDDGIVFVHDGARPLVSTELIERCYEQTIKKGSAIPAIPVVESMRQVTGDESKPVSRDHLRVIQTPQTFSTHIVLPAFKQAYLPSFTDEATVVEVSGIKVYLIDGERNNIKITTPEDMIIAAAFIKAKSDAAL